MKTYLIQIEGQMDVNELNSLSPHLMTATGVGLSTTEFTIYTDQSGLIGMLRHLHNLGLELLSVVYQAESLPILYERNEE